MVLPEDTGGVLDSAQKFEGVWLLRFDIPGVGRIRVQREALVEVEEPLPPEPPNFSVVRVGVRPFSRNDDAPRDGGRNWHGPSSAETWREVCDIARESTGFPPVLLVPDPLTEAPELPWEVDLSVGILTVSAPDDPDTGGRIRVGVADRENRESARLWFDRDVAGQMGLALLRAAAQQAARSCQTCRGEGKLWCEAHQAGDGCDDGLMLLCPDCRPTNREVARPRSCPTCHSPGLPRRIPGLEDPITRACTDSWHESRQAQQEEKT